MPALFGSNCYSSIVYTTTTKRLAQQGGGGKETQGGTGYLLRHKNCSEMNLAAVQLVHGLCDALLGHGVSLDDGLDAVQRRKLEHYWNKVSCQRADQDASSFGSYDR